ncbi:MAG: D-sedoheptulose-7-phosphate isomerase [Elusimicrobiota bacterium]
MNDKILSYLDFTQKAIQDTRGLADNISKAADTVIDTYKNGGKLILFGNGGSAADAQHIATELVSRFRKERKTLSAVALTTNTSLLTAISNDYNFEKIFSRQIESIGNEKDTVIAISTSGNSLNVIEGAKKAQQRGIKVIGLTGSSGGELKKHCDILINVPSSITSHVQECHITVGHIICHIAEEEIF